MRPSRPRISSTVDFGSHWYSHWNAGPVVDVAEPVLVVLRQVAEHDLVAEGEFAAVGLVGAGDALEQGGLADAVGADDRDLLAAGGVEGDVLEDRLVVERLPQAVDRERQLAARGLLLEADERPLDVAALEVDQLDLGDRAPARLGLAGLLGVGAEPLDELLELGDPLLLALVVLLGRDPRTGSSAAACRRSRRCT